MFSSSTEIENRSYIQCTRKDQTGLQQISVSLVNGKLLRTVRKPSGRSKEVVRQANSKDTKTTNLRIICCSSCQVMVSFLIILHCTNTASVTATGEFSLCTLTMKCSVYYIRNAYNFTRWPSEDLVQTALVELFWLNCYVTLLHLLCVFVFWISKIRNSVIGQVWEAYFGIFIWKIWTR